MLLKRGFKYMMVGILFGFVLTKAEVVSWYRIFEMFRFQAFHMYGVIGAAVVLGVLVVQLVKRKQMSDVRGEKIKFTDKRMGYKNYLLGGTIFGLGWALTGACPGPSYILLGAGYPVFIVIILSAVLGTFVYGLLRNKLPH
ncbi:DUF6691 family protein [Limibacter armeniacum]|uniref:DUF6691 family protein n=1 Tax=Limibacter armeniacum TaxID=466084 RepID=UPI002FE6763A